ncbi:MAG: ParB N-terminal domain-containing protein [Singulisphaera sp.]|nr:ParB N-terminal domain-containing protein [Singulisphaera sp.]
MPPTATTHTGTRPIATDELKPNAFSLSVYGDSSGEIHDLVESIRVHGILVPLVVTPEASGWEVLSGHRRLACARALGLREVPCAVRTLRSRAARQRAVLEYNRQRRKTFSQLMREADALESWHAAEARRRRSANLRQFRAEAADGRDSDARGGRTDATLARILGLGGKDLYRQARAIWRVAQAGDPRARSSLAQLDAGTKTIHAAYKDLRRRDRFAAGFRPTPYDVWPFKHDRAFGVPHPGSIPPAIVAHLLHYYTSPGALVVDPMAGGGTTLDVCTSMGRRCLAYDLHPVRPDILHRDVNDGFTPEASGCDLIFCDPPYHTMLARHYAGDGVDTAPLAAWLDFLDRLAHHAFATLRPGGSIALLLANQTEKDLPAGYGYLDHAFFGYEALISAGFLPERRISCPMDGAYLPQHVRRARADGRMLGQVRDLLVMRKPLKEGSSRHPEGGIPGRAGGAGSGQGIAAGQLVDLGPHERVREGRVAPDDRHGE